jgi:hypothetical protein
MSDKAAGQKGRAAGDLVDFQGASDEHTEIRT